MERIEEIEEKEKQFHIIEVKNPIAGENWILKMHIPKHLNQPKFDLKFFDFNQKLVLNKSGWCKNTVLEDDWMRIFTFKEKLEYTKITKAILAFDGRDDPFVFDVSVFPVEVNNSTSPPLSPSSPSPSSNSLSPAFNFSVSKSNFISNTRNLSLS